MNKQEVMNYLISEFEKTGFKEGITVDTSVGECYVTPCFYLEETPSIDAVEYFLVSGPVPWLGGSNFDNVCEDIANIEKLVDDLDNEKEELRKYFDTYHNSEEFDWDWYSDWHKDLYGFRPRR